MYPLKTDKIFEPYRDFFNVGMLSLWAVSWEPFLDWVAKQEPNFMSFETSDHKGSMISIRPVVEQVRKSNLPNNQKGPLHTDLLRKYCATFCVMIFEVLKEDPRYKKISKKPVVQFLRHIRNGCAHGNKFYFKKGGPFFPAEFRTKKIDTNLQGKEVFFSYISAGDIPYLLEDISKFL
jgi:hypothetical protein